MLLLPSRSLLSSLRSISYRVAGESVADTAGTTMECMNLRDVPDPAYIVPDGRLDGSLVTCDAEPAGASGAQCALDVIT